MGPLTLLEQEKKSYETALEKARNSFARGSISVSRFRMYLRNLVILIESYKQAIQILKNKK